MASLRLLLSMVRPTIAAALGLLTLAGAALSPVFLSPDFPATTLKQLVAPGLSPVVWSLVRALGGALVTCLLWMGTALINDMAEYAVDVFADLERPLPGRAIRPSELLKWGLGLQAAAFLLVLLEGSRPALVLALLGAGLGNTYSLPPFRLRARGPVANLIAGGGVALAMAGGLLSQAGMTQVGGLTILALGVLAAATSLVGEFSADDGRPLPILFGWRNAVYVSMAAAVAAYLFAFFVLLHTIGMHDRVLALFALPLAAHLQVLARLLREPGPAYARKAHGQSLVIFLITAMLYVGAQMAY